MADEPSLQTEKKMGGSGEGSSKPPQSSSSKMILNLSILALILGGGGFFVMIPQGKKMIGLEKSQEEKKHSPETSKEEPAEPGIYVNVPDLLINLKSEESKAHFLKLCLTLETKSQKDANYVTKVMPKIVDSFQVYLLELRVEDLRGAEGIYTLKQNLLARVNAEIAPLEVTEVFFRDMLVQ